MNPKDKNTARKSKAQKPSEQNESTGFPDGEERQLNAEKILKPQHSKNPLPAYARDMTLDEMNRPFPLYFLMRWEFYLALVVFVLFSAYMPWRWVSDWGVTRIFVAAIEQIVPSIIGLSQEARHLPLDASKVHLSFVHFCCAVASAYKLSTQRPAVWRIASRARFIGLFIFMSLAGAAFIYAIFFWSGHFNNGPDEAWHSNLLQVTASHTADWLLFTIAYAMAWSGLQEIVRQVRQQQ
jgi:hypothetical protein